MDKQTAIAGAPAGPARLDAGADVHCRVFRAGYPSAQPSKLDELSDILKEDRAFVWFDVVDPGPDDLAVLEHEFDLHPLAIEDAVQAHQRPKIESYGTYWFLIVHAATVQAHGITLHEIAIFAGEKFVVTVRHSPAYALDEIERRWLDHPERLRHDSGFLLYTILDTVVDGYFPVVETLQERIDDIEAPLFENRALPRDVPQEIFAMRRDAQQFRRAVLPMRDILNPIIREDIKLFPGEELAYYRDVYDHAVRIIDELDALRDIVTSALDIHLSVVANRQNEVSKQLTIIATIFLPLTFVTGFFGQNFGFMIAHIGSETSFWLLGIGGEVVALVGLLVYFRRQGWF